MGDPRNGDYISVGNITNAQGVAVGREAQAHVADSAVNVGAAKEVDLRCSAPR